MVEEFQVCWYLIVQVEVTFQGGPVKFLFRTSMVHSGDCSAWQINEIMYCLSFGLADLFVDKQDTSVE